MSQAETRAWWADVEHLRERIERRRSLAAEGGEEAVARWEAGHGAEPGPVEEPDVPSRPRRELERPRARGHVARSRAGHGPPTHPGARRTVHIRGQSLPRVPATRLRPVEDEELGQMLIPERARPRPQILARLGARPDRAAAWAVALGIFLVLAAATGHA